MSAAPLRAPALLVFAKEPVPGTVKTRLARTLGAPLAAQRYRELTALTLDHAAAARAVGAIAAVELWGAPAATSAYFSALAQRYGAALYAQPDGDLGARMGAALAYAVARHGRALLVGTDCPLLDAAQLAAAARQLDDHDAVVIPAEDGGFVLVGARRALPFAGVRWSTREALADTLAGFARAGLSCAALPELWDVDEPADLARWDALRGGAARA